MATRHSRKTNIGLMIFMLAIGAFMIWFLRAANAVEAQYDALLQAQKNESSTVGAVRVGDERLQIPSWSLFANGRMWSLVNKQRTLPTDFTPELVDATVAYAGNNTRIAASITPALTAMVKAAKTDGIDLMLSSAYRSADDQQAIYDGYLRLYGREYVNSYVALPGTSEHQTGLAVDIASASTECKRSANNCSLDYDAIIWLNENADRFGFIQRYPAGKQSITGIAGEAWHYRYVGTELARLLTNSGMTLDEFVQQVAPGYAK